MGRLHVYSHERDTSKIAFEIGKDEHFAALTGNVHVLRPGIVRVRRTFGNALDSLRMTFAPGDTIWLLDYGGEGFHHVWFHGRLTWVSDEDWDWPDSMGRPPKDPVAKMVRSALAEWWVQVRNRRGQVGWLKMTDDVQVDGADGCG